MKNTILLFTISLASLSIYGQDLQPISKAEVLTKVAQENHTLKIFSQNTLVAKGNYNQTNAVFLPNITASHTGMATTNPLMVFGSKLNQEIVTQSDFDPNKLNNPSQIENYATIFEVQQPLINLDGIYQRKAAKAKWQASQLQLARTTDYIALEVDKAYMQLQLAYKNQTVLETAKKAADENLRLANNSFKQGFLQQADVLAVQVRLTEVENQLQYAKSNIANTSNYISVLMNESQTSILKPTDSLIVTQDITVEENISENRADLQAMQYATEAHKQNYKATKLSFLPNLNAFGSYELYDDQIFQGSASGYLFGASLQWNILEGTKRFGKTQKSKAEFKKSELELEQYKAESQLELNKAKRMYQDAKNKLKLTALALEQSKESFRIRTNRYKEGLEKTSDLLLTETQYAHKQLEYYTTVFQHNYALAYLQFLTKTETK